MIWHVTVLVAVLLLMAVSAAAHSWYPADCCENRHCHPAPCDDIKNDGAGFVWFDSYSRHDVYFTRQQMKASQDDACHVCVMGWTGVCLFLPWRS